MILITKQESETVRKRYPQAEIVRTCIQKSKRHKYYMPERFSYLKLIQNTNAEAARILAENRRTNFSY